MTLKLKEEDMDTNQQIQRNVIVNFVKQTVTW